MFRDLRNQTSALMAMAFGQPGFFKPRPSTPGSRPAGADGAVSFYETDELKRTLESLVDFDLLNNGEKRLSVGAVNVRTGNFIYFDTLQDADRTGAHHGLGRAAARAARGQDRRRVLLGRRHRLEHAAPASARPGALGKLAGVPGRSVQRARRDAAANGRRSRAPEGHRLFQPHAAEHRHLRARAQSEDETARCAQARARGPARPRARRS